MLDCDDLRKEVEFDCCISCEEEFNEGIYDGLFDVVYAGNVYKVCCSGSNAVDRAVKNDKSKKV